MRQTITAALILIISMGYSQTSKQTESKITAVTVFLNKAQVTRNLKVNIPRGKTELALTGLTSSIDPESIQVSGKGKVMLLGIQHQQNYQNEFSLPKKIKSLKDSVEQTQRLLALEQSQNEILNKEEQLLLSNQKVGGTDHAVTVSELKAMADFFRGRLGDILVTKMKHDEKIKGYNQVLARLQQQLDEENELLSRNTSEILINVSTDVAAQVELDVSYVVNNAGWHPIYDLRAVDTKSPVQISYKANVYQRTGEDWNNVDLKLSTSNPNLGGLKPELYPWYVDFYQPEPSHQVRGTRRELNAPSPAGKADVAGEEIFYSLDEVVNTVQTTLNTEFEISIPYTVASSTKPTVVDIRKDEIKADYYYSVVPKLDKDAFLIADATGWEELSLMPGEANIFFEGTFVGKTYIDPNSIEDTLSISLGRDPRIVVKREQLKDLTTKKLISSSKRELKSWEISVRNAKAEPIKIIIEDQIPVSQNSQIELELTDKGGAELESLTGKLTWKLEVPASQTKKVSFKYEVKYPKDKKVAGL